MGRARQESYSAVGHSRRADRSFAALFGDGRGQPRPNTEQENWMLSDSDHGVLRLLGIRANIWIGDRPLYDEGVDLFDAGLLDHDSQGLPAFTDTGEGVVKRAIASGLALRSHAFRLLMAVIGGMSEESAGWVRDGVVAGLLVVDENDGVALTEAGTALVCAVASGGDR